MSKEQAQVFKENTLSKEAVGKPAKLRLSLALGLGLLFCPGDDIALIFAQIAHSTDANMPQAAIIHKEPKVISALDGERLEKLIV